MADEPETSPTGDRESSDDETVKADNDREDQDRIAEILEQERQLAPTPLPIGNGVVSHRYRDLLLEQDETGSIISNASVDGTAEPRPPRGPGSPADSMLSAADDTPSLHVGLFSLNPVVELFLCIRVLIRTPQK